MRKTASSRHKSLYVAGVLVLLLGACKENAESAEDAYERGVWDGAMEVCWEIRSISDHVYQRLRSTRYC